MKGSTLAMLFGKAKPEAKEGEEPDEEEGEESDAGLEATARELLDAIAADDEKAVATALKSFSEQC